MTQSSPDKPLIRIAHSPDADDAFMFYALAEGKVETHGYQYEHILCDIQTLNEEAPKGTYELTALSYHAYAYVADRYAILSVGSSIGDKYGPVLVAHDETLTKERLEKEQITVAVPGLLTTAYLALKIWSPNLKTVVMPFDQIQEAVKAKQVDAGLIIHEGQLTYRSEGLHKVVDLGEWWFETTNLVLPLGCNGIRRDLGESTIQTVAKALYDSVKWGLDNREASLNGCLKYARGLSYDKVNRFVEMYVNQMTLEADLEIRKATRLILAMGADMGIIPTKVAPEFIDLKTGAVVKS
jgi:1,4-dihydroxy-6-naphthoate synthase